MVQEVEGVRLVDYPETLCGEVERLRSYGVDIGFDLETTDKDPITSKIITVALKPKGKKATVIDIRHWSDKELRLLGSLLETLFDGSVTLVGHNLKFDFDFLLAQCGLAAHRAWDTMLQEQVITGLGMSSAAEKGVHFDMASVGKKYDVKVRKEERNWFIGLDLRPEWNEPLPPEQLRYIRQDVSVVHRIKEAQEKAIRFWDLEEVSSLENRVIFPVAGIEVEGVQIDRDGWLSVIDDVTERMRHLEEVIHLGTDQYDGFDIHVLKVRNDRYQEKWKPYEEWCRARDAFVATRKQEWEQARAEKTVTDVKWGDFKKDALAWWYERHEKMTRPTPIKQGVNLGSPLQVRDGFNDLGIPVQSVSKEKLELYRDKHPLVGVYIDYAEARKLVTVYGRERGKKDKAFIEMLDEHDRLRASYQQIGADTGRMSSFSPNFQQIPSDGLGSALRKHVVAAPGRTLVVADFSNIELRIVAELSGDKFLLDAFASGEDVHAYTAKVMFNLEIPEGVDPKKWTTEHDAVVGGRVLANTSYRKIAKTINYMLLYGAGVRKLAAMLGVSETDARSVLKIYYETFSAAIAWLSKQKSALDEARKRRESRVAARTRSGRIRWFDIPRYPKMPGTNGPAAVEDVEKYKQAVDDWKKSNASIQRQLANTPIQGLSADITKEAAALWYETVGYNPNMKLVAIIHDEFILEVVPDLVQRAQELLRRVMVQAMEKYLHVVNLGEVDPVQTPYWMH